MLKCPMVRARQPSLFPRGLLATLSPLAHGGDLVKGRHKAARPFSRRRPLHIVLRSSRARGRLSLLTHDNRAAIGRLLRHLSLRHSVHVYQFANAGNHLHLLARCADRISLQTFLRAFAGLVARAVTGAEKGRPFGKFWDHLAYSRVLTWGREYRGVRAYILQNEMEAAGLPTDRKPFAVRIVREQAGPRETRAP